MRSSIGLAVTLAVLAASCSAARGAEGSVPTYYVQQGKGNITYAVQDMGTGVHAVELWVSSDGGKTWKRKASDEKLTGRFTYEVAEEGAFEFVSVAIDKIGNCEKELSEHTVPGFRMVVDRTPPTVTAKGPQDGILAPAGAAFAYAWTAEDSYLQPDAVELQLRFKGEKNWRTVLKDLPAKGRKRVKLPEVNDGVAEVRFVARDRAGNKGYAAAGSVRFDRLAPQGRITGPQTANSLDAEIGYQVSDPGVADLASVTLWISTNAGRSWRKLANAPIKGRSVKVRLPKVGSYGLAISATDTIGNQLAPPARKTKPPFVMSTDTEAPQVLLVTKLEGRALSVRDKVTVEWKATDVNLGPNPVSVELSINDGKTWSTVVKDLENSGSFTWTPPKHNSKKCLLRVVVADLLGNTAQAVSRTFTLDNKPPESKVKFQPAVEEEGKKAPEKGAKKKKAK